MHDSPNITRIRHELKRRRLTVKRVEILGPRMKRVVLQGDELRGFSSPGFDDHIKVFFPGGMRDFTPRHYDAAACELWIDFVMHDAGPAMEWARAVASGQPLEIGGPKGSALIAVADIEAHFLIGDETALPAIGRRLAELPASAPVLVIAETDAAESWPALVGPPSMRTVWVPREADDTPPGSMLINALRKEVFVPRSFFWVACESNVARAIRRHLTTERGIDKRWVKAAGYWRRNASGSHERIDDE